MALPLSAYNVPPHRAKTRKTRRRYLGEWDCDHPAHTATPASTPDPPYWYGYDSTNLTSTNIVSYGPGVYYDVSTFSSTAVAYVNGWTGAFDGLQTAVNSWSSAIGSAVAAFNTLSGVITPEQQAEIFAADQARQDKLLVINKRADALLLQHLSESQRRSYLHNKAFEVIAQSGRRYVLKEGFSGNVTLVIASGQAIRKYCVYSNDPGGALPMGDHLLIQMLALQFNEQEFLRKANTWDLLKPGTPFLGQGVDADAAPVELMAA